MARDVKVMIRLTTEVKDRFQQLADEKGMTMSSLGSYAIGTFVQQEERKQLLEKEGMDKLAPLLGELIKEMADDSNRS